MRTELADVLRACVLEAHERAARADIDATAEFIREHVVDRWYRFARWGVTTRAQLAGVAVRFAVDAHGVHTTTVDVSRTPLAP